LSQNSAQATTTTTTTTNRSATRQRRKMEIAKSLVKCVARAFYDTKHILVIDALMIHNAYVPFGGFSLLPSRKTFFFFAADGVVFVMMSWGNCWAFNLRTYRNYVGG